MQAPIFLVALFGLYSVTSLVYGVITFRTVPHEAASLQQVQPSTEYFRQLSVVSNFPL